MADASAIENLRDRLRGSLVGPGEAGYEEAAAPWNGRYEGRPGLVARCRGTADVMAAVRFAREHDLTIAVRSGGHDYAGNWAADGVLLVDLSGMRAVRIDPTNRRARVEPGATWGDFEPLGGAVAEVDPGATAFPHRSADYGVHILPGWSDPDDDEEMMSWARAFHEALAPDATGGTYVNLLDGDEESPDVAAWGENLDRLWGVKARWDPANVFRTNHNIAPAV